jgi:predicted Zn-dependent protease
VVALKGATEAAFSIKDPSAGAFVDKLVLRTPEDPVANAMAGSLAYERTDCHSAIQHFAIGMRVVQKNTLAGLQFSHCLLSEGQAARAVEILDELPTRDSDETVSYDLAFALFSAGRYQESVARLESLKARGLGGAAVSDLLGSAYGKLDRVQDALDAYRSACDEAPTVPGYYIDLVQFAMEHTSENAAIEVLNTAIERIPNSSALLTIRGSIYAFIGDTVKAEQDFAKAERVEPTSGYGRLGRSLYLRDRGKSREAEAHLRKELASNPKDVKARYFLAEILMDSDSAPNRIEPKRLLEDVRKKRPNDPNVLLLLGKILLEEKNAEAALPLLLLAHQVDPTSAPVLNRLLQVYRALGLKEDAGKTANELRQIIDSDRNAEARRNRFHIAALPTSESAR